MGWVGRSVRGQGEAQSQVLSRRQGFIWSGSEYFEVKGGLRSAHLEFMSAWKVVFFAPLRNKVS